FLKKGNCQADGRIGATISSIDANACDILCGRCPPFLRSHDQAQILHLAHRFEHTRFARIKHRKGHLWSLYTLKRFAEIAHGKDDATFWPRHLCSHRTNVIPHVSVLGLDCQRATLLATPQRETSCLQFISGEQGSTLNGCSKLPGLNDSTGGKLPGDRTLI